MQRFDAQAGGTRHSLGDLAVAASWRYPKGHGGPTQLLHRSPDFQSFVDYGIAHTSLGRCSSMSRHSCDRRVRRDVETALSPDNVWEIRGGLTFSNLREVIMTMSEYEERFRPPAPSLHQTFAEVRGPNQRERRSRRLWVTAALVGAMAITSKTALHHSSDANSSQVSKSAIQACDFFHR